VHGSRPAGLKVHVTVVPEIFKRFDMEYCNQYLEVPTNRSPMPRVHTCVQLDAACEQPTTMQRRHECAMRMLQWSCQLQSVSEEGIFVTRSRKICLAKLNEADVGSLQAGESKQSSGLPIPSASMHDAHGQPFRQANMASADRDYSSQALYASDAVALRLILLDPGARSDVDSDADDRSVRALQRSHQTYSGQAYRRGDASALVECTAHVLGRRLRLASECRG